MLGSEIVGTVATFHGYDCDVIREQVIRTSGNESKQCFVIRIHGLELWKALRLVNASELSKKN
jgi:hypothetical protein